MNSPVDRRAGGTCSAGDSIGVEASDVTATVGSASLTVTFVNSFHGWNASMTAVRTAMPRRATGMSTTGLRRVVSMTRG